MDAALLDATSGANALAASGHDAAPGHGSRRLRIKLATPGSRGDIQPMVVLGQHLQKRGHDVTVCVEAPYVSFVRSWGLQVATLEGQNWCEDVEFVEKVAGKSMFELANMVRAREVAMGISPASKLASYVPALQGADLIVSSFMSLSPGLAMAEASNAAWAMVLLTPGLAPSREYPSIFIRIPRCLSCLNMATHNFGLRFLWGLNKAHVAPFRAKLGVSAIASPLGDMEHAKTQVIKAKTAVAAASAKTGHSKSAAATEWPLVLVAGTSLLSPTGRYASDWPAGTLAVGAFFPPATPDDQVPQALKDFLAGAEAAAMPVVCIGFGSATCRPAALLQCARDLAKLPIRVIVLAGATRLDDANISEHRNVLVLPSAPHDWLFPRIAAVVHSAGIGVLTACLRAGVPQVPCPFTTDQPSNGAMLVRLGVAPCVVPGGWKGIDAGRLTAAVRAAALPGNVRDELVLRARAAAETVRAESARALDRAAEALEDQAARFRLSVPA